MALSRRWSAIRGCVSVVAVEVAGGGDEQEFGVVVVVVVEGDDCCCCRCHLSPPGIASDCCDFSSMA